MAKTQTLEQALDAIAESITAFEAIRDETSIRLKKLRIVQRKLREEKALKPHYTKAFDVFRPNRVIKP